MEPMQLVRPATDHLPGYIAALEQGGSADNLGGEAAARLPSLQLWLWDGEFCGSERLTYRTQIA